MTEESDTKKKYLSDELKSARNKLLYFSLAIFIITVFEPRLTGFLGNFSIKVSYFPNLFVGLIYLALLWLFIRYVILLSTEFEDLTLSYNPLKLVNYIGKKWHNEIGDLNELKKTIDIDINSLKLHGIKKPEKHLKRHTKGYSVQIGNEAISISRQANTYQSYIKKKNKLSNLKVLVLTDLIFPLFIWFSATLSLIYGHSTIADKIFETDKVHQAEYKIESATTEVKDIKSK